MPPPPGRTPQRTPQRAPQGRDVLHPLPPVHAEAPLFSFASIDEYEKRHRTGTNMEFEFEKREIRRFNAALLKFKAFPMIAIRHGRSSKDILLFIEPRERDSMLPKEDERCQVDIPGVGVLGAMRKENPCSSWAVLNHFWDRHLVFETTIESRHFDSIIPFFSGPEMITASMEMPQPHQIQHKTISFELRLSYSTMKAEIGALDIMMSALRDNQAGMERKANALKYIMKFEPPASHVNLFAHFPHMTSPTSIPRHVSPELVGMMRALDSHQQNAYRSLMSNIPAGVGILPGGPGAGKSHFITVLVAALQSEDEIVYPGERSIYVHRNTTLLLCDINKAATDIANKFHQLYRKLRLTRLSETTGDTVHRVVVRMFCWSYEKVSVRRGRLEAEDHEVRRRIARGDRDPMSGANGFAGGVGFASYNSVADESDMIDVHRFSLPFLRAGTSSAARTADLQQEHVAPTLDQFAREDYERNKHTEYSNLRNMLRGVDIENFDSTIVVSYAVEKEIEKVYRNALRKIDVLATTPVTASKFSTALANIFNPTLVIFDEAPHAREASTLIPIAKFSPVAWIFTGDHRQTRPWVGSCGKGPNVNKYSRQLRVSMMERASRLHPRGHALMINHRARGGIQQLPSMLFYDNNMVSAYSQAQQGWLPPSTYHLQNSYMRQMKRNTGSWSSRLIVVLRGIGAPTNVQESWYHPRHHRWVMNLVSKLLRDRNFRQPDGREQGTILIMAPYKAASFEYRKAIKELRAASHRVNTSKVEARTIDTAQGHEADFVILDLVRNKITDHLDDPNRLCVALTRARQAEVLLMHEEMVRQLKFNPNFNRCPLAHALRCCEEAGELIYDPADI